MSTDSGGGVPRITVETPSVHAGESRSENSPAATRGGPAVLGNGTQGGSLSIERLEALAAHASAELENGTVATIHPAELQALLHDLAVARAQAKLGYVPPSAWRVVSGTTHAEWLKAREEYLTASDVAAVCGLNPWKSRNKAVKEKAFPTGERPAATPMVLGQYLEDGVAGAFGHLTKRTVVRVRSAAGASVLVAHPSIPGLAASPDAVELGPDGTPVAAVEVKVTKGDPEQYGWTPALVQLQIQMACCGLELGHVVACAGSRIAWRMDIRPKAGFLARLSGEVERFWDDVRALRAAGPAPRKGKG